jgi:hypothetical protein
MQPAMTRVHLIRDVYLIAAHKVPDRPRKLAHRIFPIPDTVALDHGPRTKKILHIP